jgi:hypothetical protein
MAADKYETLREQFRPQKTRVLFVAESRPASGRFFYRGDSTLELFTREAFHSADGTPDSAESMEAFLERFKSSGCYLVDLCVEPANKLSPGDRTTLRRQSEKRLAATINSLQPDAVIIIMNAIESNVRRAIKSAGLHNVPIYGVPFPAMLKSNERRYVTGLSAILTELRSKRILHDP